LETIKKQYLKSKNVCKVTFRLPKEAVEGSKSVHLVGDFNDWNKKKNPMKVLKDGSAKLVIELEPGKEYRFRYLLDGERWENDWNADRYEASPMAYEDDSIINV
jgi:1,4-alpha-glucan branching enzyme